MKYNGIELVEVTERPQAFKPHRMLCWNADPMHPLEEFVIAIVKRSDDIMFITDHSIWPHGAEIPEKPKKWATYRQVSRWLAEGNGEVRCGRGDVTTVLHYSGVENCECDSSVKVRKWDDSDWHEPTLVYIGLQE